MDYFDVNKLINEVFQNRCLWDHSDPNYHLRVETCKSWRAISQDMNIPVDDLKKKWRGLRDTFGRELKKATAKLSDNDEIEPTSKWPYFKYLMFLRNTMTQRDKRTGSSEIFFMDNADAESDGKSSDSECPSSSAQNNTLETLIKNEFEEQPEEETSMEHLRIRSKRRRDVDEDFLNVEERNSYGNDTGDSDAQFLMSLVPFLRDVPKYRKLMVRMKLQQVLIDEQKGRMLITDGL